MDRLHPRLRVLGSARPPISWECGQAASPARNVRIGQALKRSSQSAARQRAEDHRQAVKPERAQPLHNGNIQSTEALKGRRNTGRGTTPDRRGNRERGVSVAPSGFPVCDGSVYRGSAIAPPPACGLATPTGFSAGPTRGQTSFRRENECHFDERTIVNPRKP